jgi:carboxyl-terminal processing protease
VIVSTHGRSAQEDFTYSAHVEGTWRVPLVLLIDRDTASAAEIFAGAIREHNRGTVVGVRSYGKGSVQGIFPLTFGGAGVRLTTAKFYSPSGRPYNRIGVEPDVVVHLTARPSDGSPALPSGDDDAMLAAALQAAARRTGTTEQVRSLR